MSVIKYKAVFSEDSYHHRFGGNDWITPVCENCGDNYHQIASFDLNDPRLSYIYGICDKSFPIVSCVNCSSCWGDQLFKVDFEKKEIKLIGNTDNIHWVIEDEYRITVPIAEHSISFEELLYEDEYEGTLDDLGGDYFITAAGNPCFVMEADTVCPLCKGEMKYVATVCGDHVGILENEDFEIGETILYYMFCSECDVIKVIGQST